MVAHDVAHLRRVEHVLVVGEQLVAAPVADVKEVVEMVDDLVLRLEEVEVPLALLFAVLVAEHVEVHDVAVAPMLRRWERALQVEADDVVPLRGVQRRVGLRHVGLERVVVVAWERAGGFFEDGVVSMIGAVWVENSHGRGSLLSAPHQENA